MFLFVQLRLQYCNIVPCQSALLCPSSFVLCPLSLFKFSGMDTPRRRKASGLLLLIFQMTRYRHVKRKYEVYIMIYMDSCCPPYLHRAVDPGKKAGHSAIYSWLLSLSTTCSPTGDSGQIPAFIISQAHQWTSTVPLRPKTRTERKRMELQTIVNKQL